MPTIGQGAAEIRIWEESGTFRIVYLARLVDAIYVLHCFQKKTLQTSKRDIAIAAQRYKELIEELKS